MIRYATVLTEIEIALEKLKQEILKDIDNKVIDNEEEFKRQYPKIYALAFGEK